MTFDRRERTLTKWWGVVGLHKPWATESLDGYRWVGLYKEVRQNKSSSSGGQGAGGVDREGLRPRSQADERRAK